MSTSSKSKKHDLPTAASINSEAASARCKSSALATTSSHVPSNNRTRQSDLRRSLHSQHNHFSDVNDLSTDDLYATEV
jgi:hypothetical protein